MKTNEKVSNYIKLCSEWAEKFLQMDKEELKKRLPELKEEDGYLKITHFGVPFSLVRPLRPPRNCLRKQSHPPCLP